MKRAKTKKKKIVSKVQSLEVEVISYMFVYNFVHFAKKKVVNAA